MRRTVLGLSASSSHCSLAVALEGRIAGDMCWDSPRSNVARMVSAIREMLSGAGVSLNDISAVVVDRGPGSYTGTRTAIATAIGLTFGTGTELKGCTSLECIYNKTTREGGKEIIAVVEATRNQFSLFDGVKYFTLPSVEFGEFMMGKTAAGLIRSAAAREALSGRLIEVYPEGRECCLMDQVITDTSPVIEPVYSRSNYDG